MTSKTWQVGENVKVYINRDGRIDLEVSFTPMSTISTPLDLEECQELIDNLREARNLAKYLNKEKTP